MKTTGKRIVSILLCLAMVLSVIPAVFAADDCGGNSGICVLTQFTDAPKYSNWAHAGIEYCVNNGLMNGTSATLFSPKTAMTRAMLVTVLYRIEGQPGAGSSTFTDVKSSAWYYAAVTWAADKGIVTGVGNGKFNPNGNVTREQIATILYRFAGFKGYNTTKQNNLSGFADSSKVGKWYVDGMKWAVAEGLINGSAAADGKTYLNPQGDATREQIAAILMRFDKATRTPTDTNPLRIKTQPSNVTKQIGAKATFTVAAEGGKSPYTYQWQCRYLSGGSYTSWSNINANWATGAKTASLTVNVTSVGFDFEYQYRCVITDANGKQVTSNAASVQEKLDPLIIKTQPKDVVTAVGSKATFTVAAEGGKSPYTYQWQYRYLKSGTYTSWSDLNANWATGAKTASLVVNVSSGDFNSKYQYRCVITDAKGTQVTSNAANPLKKNDEPLVFITHPEDQYPQVNATVTLSVAVEGGTPPYTYQWQYLSDESSSWRNVTSNWYAGSKTAVLTFKVTQDDIDDCYRYRCEITDAAGDITVSVPAFIYSYRRLRIKTQPVNQMSVPVGSPVALSVAAEYGQPPYTYHWQLRYKNSNGTYSSWRLITGSWAEGYTTNYMSFKVVQEDYDDWYQYRCQVTDASGAVSYSRATAMVAPGTPLMMKTQPVDADVAVGNYATFTAEAMGGKPPYTFQWQFSSTEFDWVSMNDGRWDGKYTDTLTFGVTPGQLDFDYHYRCMITDSNGKKIYSDSVRVLPRN